MSISLTFDHEHKLGVGRCGGTLSIEQLSNYLDEWKNPDLINYDELFIMRAVNADDVSFGELLSHARNAVDVNRFGSGDVRTAIVVDDEKAGARAEFWRAAISLAPADHHRIARVFTSEEEAQQWLAEPRTEMPG